MDTTRDAAGNEPLWTALDVAHYLNVSRATVYNLVDRGVLAVVRIGALLRFHPDDARKLATSPRAPAAVVALKPRSPKKPGPTE